MTTTEARPQSAAPAFPADFTWGAATAAYQIEGSVDVDGRGPSIWDVFSHTPGRTFQGHTGDVAVDHYARYRDDVALMADLGLGAYRFSVAWARVLPEGHGRVEQRGLDFYSRLVDELLAAGIEPWLTLYHWDLPQGLQDSGGWTDRDTASRFADYASVVHGALGDRVRHWSTLNEPWCSSMLAHQAGQHAPGEQDGAQAARAVHHLLLGHGLATQVLRSRGVQDLGITLNLAPVDPASDRPVDVDAARRVDGQLNRLFLEPLLEGAYPADVVTDLASAGARLPVRAGDLEIISTPLDWLGVNYYYRQVVAGGAPQTGEAKAWIGGDDLELVLPPAPRTTMDWGVQPEGMVELLGHLRDRYPALPVVVTENGSAWPDVVDADGEVRDDDRTDYLERHLAAAAEAIAQGVDLRGYFYWSLLDNYEWARGYAQRFGLVHVDYETQRRTVKSSGKAYAAAIRDHHTAHAV